MKILTIASKTLMSIASDFWLMGSDNSRRHPRPGQLLASLPQPMRDDLAGLKSEGIGDIRVEDWMGSESQSEAWGRAIREAEREAKNR